MRGYQFPQRLKLFHRAVACARQNGGLRKGNDYLDVFGCDRSMPGIGFSCGFRLQERRLSGTLTYPRKLGGVLSVKS
jgi:hypothetical protein